MLAHLSIRNFALIERLDVEFANGFTVITGETGAGKSITFDALALLLGGRATTEVIRTGENDATIAGHFVVTGRARERVHAALIASGLEPADELLVRRTVSRSGPNRVFVNDVPATVGALGRILDPLVDLLGQHQHLALTQVDTHRDLVDAFGGHRDLVEAMAAAWTQWRDARARIAELREAASARVERLELLGHQKRELEALSLKPGEMDDLERRIARVRNLSKLREHGGGAARLLYDAEPSASTLVARADESLARAAALDSTLEPLLSRLREARVVLNDVAREVSVWASDLGDDDDADTIETRHEQLRRATRKYGTDDAGLIEKLARVRAELVTLDNLGESTIAAERAELAARENAVACARRLDVARAAAGEALFARTAESLAKLGMGSARLTLSRPSVTADTIGPHGAGDVEILFSANRGEALAPLRKVASGGELSRLMLAIKTSLISTDPVDTYVFDEVDTGIGGAIGEIVGRLIADLGRTRQVICITHLPQIACHGTTHFRVSKSEVGDRTVSALTLLDLAERTEELSRMLGGVDPGEASRLAAADLLARARAHAVA
jgi:DNA repair protein RecN (Recombination protein N)